VYQRLVEIMNDGGVAFPDPREITPHAIAFARMMFAHTAFEREIGALQDELTGDFGFGERRCNQWGTRERPSRMVKLIKEKRGDQFPYTAQIETLLTDAIDPCEQRNLLTHGRWWCFHRPTSTILVRGGTRWEENESPEHREYTAADIEALVGKFQTTENELNKVRRLIEPPLTEDEIRAIRGT
jgi:hypothetical protein